jgi:enoyl-CoA hydratase/carnithine racemase
MTEMMLTGRRVSADEALRFGLVDYVVPRGMANSRAKELATTIASHSRMSNHLAIHAIGHIDEMPEASGLFTEALASALIRYGSDARQGVEAFLKKKQS